MESKIAHLNIIQATVSRLANNSFLLKGWSITIVSAIVALAAKDGTPKLVALALFPAIVFWALDGYFLFQERLFRELYNRVRLLPYNAIDFDMTLAPNASGSWPSATFSRTIVLFHGCIVALIVVLALIVFSQ
ncbi:MAG: hypothetical protein U1E59_11835 [Amaricoccus sp.]